MVKQKKDLREYGLMTAAYSVPLQPVQDALLKDDFGAAVFRLMAKSIRPAPINGYEAQKLSGLSFGLQTVEQPVILNVRNWLSRYVHGIEDFPYMYFTGGAEEAIREFESFMKAKGDFGVDDFDAEYEGFTKIAEARDLVVQRMPPYRMNERTLEKALAYREVDPRSAWFISNPFAKDGNFLPQGLVEGLAEAGHRVFLDLSYLFTACIEDLPGGKKLDVTSPNIEGVACSFSKPFSFWLRMGVFFSRVSIPVLESNKEFKNIASIEALNRLTRDTVLDSYLAYCKSLQAEAIIEAKRLTGLPLVASHSFLLAHIPDGVIKNPEESEFNLEPYRRGGSYRFCLSPYLVALDPGMKKFIFS